jgi:polysaccharide deacetylase 2 family uncharacterized protein YibQ
MTVDDLSTPLGQQLKRRRKLPVALPKIIAAALAMFLGVFVLWTVVGDDPFGGEPMVAVPIDPHAAIAMKRPEIAVVPEAAAPVQGPVRYDGPANAPMAAPVPPSQAVPGNSKTVTIIDGKTGARQEVVIPAASNGASPAESPPADQKFVEMTSHGPIPKVAADGMRPAEAFARPVKPLPGKSDAPRVALIVGGLGVSTSATAAAIVKLPEAVTLAFMPYGSDVDRLVSRARGEGHEVLLQVPMEPFGYPDNDSGPQTLLTSLTPEQNLDRLHWLMSRFQGYVGIAGAMGARFTASEQSFAPVLRETAKRGLMFFDDGSNPRSVAGRIAGANNLPFAKADEVLDLVPTAAEIDHALGRLEMAARERGVAVGISSALPVSIDQIAKWAKAAESRGLLLVPITAVAVKAKQS